MRHVTTGLVLGALLLTAAPPLQGQDIQGRYTITVLGSRIYYDESSALQDAWSGGVEGEYNLTNWLSLGAYLFGARPTTDGSFFPLVRLQFRDTVLFELVSQQVTQLDYGLSANVRYTTGPLHLRALGGVGGYTFYLDDERIDRPVVPGQLKDSFSGLEFVIGAGIAYSFGETGSIELRARDFIFTDFDRERFNVSEPLLSAPSIPHPRENIPEPESTIHNIHLELAFSFILGGSR